MEDDETRLLAEKETHESWLNRQEGVTGTGIGLDAGGRTCIKVFTNRMSAATKEAIRSRLGTVPVDFEETGEFRAL